MNTRNPVKYCLVDAFTDTAFKGNPAVVCLLEEDREDHWMQAVAREFNQPITCYLTRLSNSDDSDNDSSSSDNIPPSRYRIRWFTRTVEVRLCGHATLAASHFLFTHQMAASADSTVEFSTLHSGILTATRRMPPTFATTPSDLSNPTIQLDFPAFALNRYDGPIHPSSFSKSLGGSCTSPIIEILTSSSDVLLVLPSGEAVEEVVPNFAEMMKFPGRGVIVTGAASSSQVAASSSGFDYITRFFSPKEGTDEASRRGGVLNLHVDEKNQRVLIKGKCFTVMEGSLFL